jgi:putative ABC transport system permease protein
VNDVPVGRRNLFADRRRAMLGIAGVAIALLMVLALDAVFAGAMQQVTRYVDTSGADVVVSQRGVRTMHMSSSWIPAATVDRVRAIPGVRWAEPILYDSGTVISGRARELTYLIGYVSGRRGGPVSLVGGRQPGRGQIVLDDDAASRLGVSVGDHVDTLGRTWVVSGLTTGMTNIVNSVSYVPLADFAAARDVAGTISYVLVGTAQDADAIARDIANSTGLTVQTRQSFSDQERSGIKGMSAELMQIMTFAALVVGLAVVGLTLYAATLARLHEIGVMKALGSRTIRLTRLVVGQASWTVASALALAVVLELLLGFVLNRTKSTFPLVLEPGSVVRVALGAAVLAAIGALAPLRRVARVDPASVFRR